MKGVGNTTGGMIVKANIEGNGGARLGGGDREGGVIKDGGSNDELGKVSSWSKGRLESQRQRPLPIFA